MRAVITGKPYFVDAVIKRNNVSVTHNRSDVTYKSLGQQREPGIIRSDGRFFFYF